MVYKDYHEFPNGLCIEHESSICDDYIAELKSVSSQDELNILVDKWKYLCPDIVHNEISVDILIALMKSKDMQNEFAAKGDKIYISLLAPIQLVRLSISSKQYGVPAGTILLQLYNNDCIRELSNGVWIIKSQPHSGKLS